MQQTQIITSFFIYKIYNMIYKIHYN